MIDSLEPLQECCQTLLNRDHILALYQAYDSQEREQEVQPALEVAS